MMQSVMDDLQPEPWSKMLQKCKRLSWKTDDRQFTMFATLSDFVRNVPASFVGWGQHAAHCTKTCANAAEQWSKGTLHCCQHWAQGTDQKRPQLYLHLHYWWRILGVWAWPWNNTAVISVENSNFNVTEKVREVRSNVQWMLICFFRHRRHRAQGICSTRTDGEWKILLQWSEANEGKHPAETSRQVAQQLLGPASWQRSSSHVSRCATVFGFYEDGSHSPTTLLTGPPRPVWIFPIPKDESEAQGAAFWQYWRDPDHITGCEEDADMKQFPAVLLIMEIQMGSLYQCRRGWW